MTNVVLALIWVAAGSVATGTVAALLNSRTGVAHKVGRRRWLRLSD